MEAMQRDINPTMRGILVDWLVEVAEEYELHPETLFLTVNFIDRCLSKYSCARPQLQLVGVTCMLIAAKFEEIYAPQVRSLSLSLSLSLTQPPPSRALTRIQVVATVEDGRYTTHTLHQRHRTSVSNSFRLSLRCRTSATSRTARTCRRRC
jgi:hypothetical protein